MEFSKWKTMLKSKNPLDRSEASDFLPQAKNEELIPCLIAALDDDYDVVQMNVLDSLGFFPCEPVRKAIRKILLKKPNELVRGYALEALGKTGTIKDLINLLSLLDETPSLRIRIFILSGLYQGIQKYTINGIEKSIGSDDYLIRSMGANIFLELFYSWNRNLSLAKGVFESQLKKEVTAGGREPIEKALMWLTDYLKISKKYIE